MDKIDYKKLEGKTLYSPFFKKDIKVWSVESNDDWMFMSDNKLFKARTPLGYFIQHGLVKD